MMLFTHNVKRSKMPLTKTVTLTAGENEPIHIKSPLESVKLHLMATVTLLGRIVALPFDVLPRRLLFLPIYLHCQLRISESMNASVQS